MKRICCIGISVADVVAKPIHALPENGRLELVDSIRMYTGGCAANSAIDLSVLGLKSSVISLVGQDAFGSFVIDELLKHGVDIRGIKQTDKVGTSVSIVLSLPDGERSFIHHTGANGVFTLSDIDETVWMDSDFIFVGGSLLMPAFDGAPTAALMKKAQAAGKFTILDTAWDSTGRWMSAIQPVLPHLDLFIPSYEEAEQLSGESEPEKIARCFTELGAKNVVIKLGSDGCYVHSGDDQFYSPALPAKVVDTCGAGDSFVAGFLAGLAQGWDYHKSAVFANAVGASCVQQVGASTGIRPMADMLETIKKISAEDLGNYRLQTYSE